MKFLKGLGDAIAGIFTGDKVARVTTDPRVSEPVFMMLRSMKNHPHHWRVKLIMPTSYADMLSSRHTPYWPGWVGVQITDRRVGECYEACIRLDSRWGCDLMHATHFHQLAPQSAEDAVRMAQLTRYPDWLNELEARELHYALNVLMFKRLALIRARKSRESERAEKDAAVRALARREQERKRLINVYGAHNE